MELLFAPPWRGREGKTKKGRAISVGLPPSSPSAAAMLFGGREMLKGKLLSTRRRVMKERRKGRIKKGRKRKTAGGMIR